MRVQGNYTTHHEVYVEVDPKKIINQLIYFEQVRRKLPTRTGGRLGIRPDDSSMNIPKYHIVWGESGYGSHYMEWDEYHELTEDEYNQMKELFDLRDGMLALIKE